MGGRRLARGAALLAAVVLLGTGALVWKGELSPRSRFADWLAAQPQVASVDQLFPATRPDGDVARPTAQVSTRDPLTLAHVGAFMAALERYAAEHAEATSYTVQLHHGRDHVLAAGGHTGNAEVVAALRALRGLPDLYAVDIGIDPYPAHATAVLTTGSDLVAAAETLAHSGAAAALRSPTWRSAGLTVRGEGLPHIVTVHSDVAPSAGAAQAFAVATRLEGRSPVQLVVQPPDADGTWTQLRLDEHSPTAATTRAAVSALGFGMPQHFERVPGGPYSDHDASFDTVAWRKAVLPVVEAVPGVRAARLSDPNSSDRAVLDVRFDRRLDPAALAAAVPESVDVVALHTEERAPEYARKAVLPEDPQTRCPAGLHGTVNTSFTGPAQVLSQVSGQLEALVRSPDVTCVHWYVPPSDSAQWVQSLQVRVPLRSSAWRPLLDQLVASRRGPSGADLSIAVVVAQPDASWTPVLLLPAGGDEADATTLDGASPAQTRSGSAALQALIDYWRTALR
ncbi:MAG TPA: hypothetical protein VGK60_00165 [Pedococcus sp.]